MRVLKVCLNYSLKTGATAVALSVTLLAVAFGLLVALRIGRERLTPQ